LDEINNLLIVVTPWGPRSAAKKVIEIIRNLISNLRKDCETTNPFPRLPGLSEELNNIRMAALLCNDFLYRNENAKEYISGMELFVASLDTRDLSWLQFGHPQVFLLRLGDQLLVLSNTIDLSLELSSQEVLLPPLPSELMGVERNIRLMTNSFRVREGDRLFLVSRSIISRSFYSVVNRDLTLEQLTSSLSQEDPGIPFWVGVLDL